MNKRNGRVNFTLQRELGMLIDESISDPRLAPMTSVTRVECTADYSTAHVYISSLGDPEVRPQDFFAERSTSESRSDTSHASSSTWTIRLSRVPACSR